jgi:ubiquinone/menaquinone biosynthesis C-methylase UbiE
MSETEYALDRTPREYERLIEQAVLVRPMTERMLTAAAIGTGMNVLDVGCGVGDVSFLVSERGSVLGVDVDHAALAVAERRRAEQDIANVEFGPGTSARSSSIARSTRSSAGSC